MTVPLRSQAARDAQDPKATIRVGEVTAAPPELDKIDVVLGEWVAERSESALAPVALTARVSRLAQILEVRMERRAARFGLDWGQFMVLAALRGAGAPFRMSPRELHRLLLLSPAAITNRLYRLEAKGFIERTSDPSDRRSMPVVLTTLGLSTIDRAMAAMLEDDHKLLTLVDDTSLDITFRTLRQLLSAYEEYPKRRRARRDASLPDSPAISTDGAEPVPGVAPLTRLAPKPKRWPSSPQELEHLQKILARRTTEAEPWTWTRSGSPAIGAVFVSLPRHHADGKAPELAWAAVVVMEEGKVVATATATRNLIEPYRPSYLALTIGPILEDVVTTLAQQPDIIIVNASGRDHVRGAGLAIQLGAALGLPTVGVTDRPEIGVSTDPTSQRGDWTPVRVENRIVGFRVRTLSRARPVTAHAGWLTTPETARDLVIQTTGRTHVPEPLQRARQLSRRLRSDYEKSTGGGLQDGIHPPNP